MQLDGEEDIDVDLWPALVVAQRSANEFCSATLIGPRVLLTAAHCLDARNAVDHAATVGVTVTMPVGPFTASSCAMHTAYVAAPISARRAGARGDSEHALCELGRDVPDTLLETLTSFVGDRGGGPKLSRFSNYGKDAVDIAAPGCKIFS